MVTVRGRVVEQPNEGADEHADKLAKKYLGVDKYPLRSSNEKRIIVKIKPERVSETFIYLNPCITNIA